MSNVFVHVLGNSTAISTLNTDHTSLAIQTSNNHILVDCPGSPIFKVLKIGMDLDRISTIIITHRHPDHIYGVPSLIQTMGLLQRKNKLEIVGLKDSIKTIKSLIKVFELSELSSAFLKFKIINSSKKKVYKLYRDDNILITGSLVDHSVPTLAIRITNNHTLRSVTYSSDTSPSQNLIRLAKDTDILIHECTMALSEESTIHTNGVQIGEIADKANAKKLEIVHVPLLNKIEVKQLKQQIRQSYNKPVNLPKQYTCYKI